MFFARLEVTISIVSVSKWPPITDGSVIGLGSCTQDSNQPGRKVAVQLGNAIREALLSGSRIVRCEPDAIYIYIYIYLFI